MKITTYRLNKKSPRPARLALASDLHGCLHQETGAALQKSAPDYILIPGDLMDDLELREPQNDGYAFLRACAAIAPTFYSLGNHELACYHKGNPWRHPVPVPLDDNIRQRIASTGAHLLENAAVCLDGMVFCGINSGINGKTNAPDEQALAEFDRMEGFRVLLCHHPEYFVPYIQKTSIDLTVCGHAHGGQWRIFDRGIYAPGQGLFPKYTAGVIDERCVISRGLGNHTKIPRIFNTPELVLIELS